MVADPPLIWVTRARPGADETAARLRALGFATLIAPVIETRAIAPDPAGWPIFDTVAFTSAEAVRVFSGLTSDRTARAFAVGDATALVAAASGWRSVTSASGNVDDLVRLIASDPQATSILHPCAEVTAGDLVGALVATGRRVLPMPVYRTHQIDPPADELVQRILVGGISGVSVYSPSAADGIVRWLKPFGGLPQAILFALSDQCAETLQGTRFREIVISPFPREAALLKVISDTFAQAGFCRPPSPERPVSP